MSDPATLRKQQSGIASFAVDRFGANTTGSDDLVAVEEPLEIRLGFTSDGLRHTQSISITMRTPGEDHELAVGFLYGEGIVSRAKDIDTVFNCGPVMQGVQNVVRVELKPDVGVDLERLRRNFYTTSSCGVCGKTSLEALKVITNRDVADDVLRIDARRLCRLPEQLRQRQRLFAETGGIHASGLFDSGGSLLDAYEDVGRHNALDKLIGTQLMGGRLPLEKQGIIVSGRASFELMQKALVAGCPMLVAVGAPSSLAVELAHNYGMTLVGFLREDRFNIYSRAERVVKV